MERTPGLSADVQSLSYVKMKQLRAGQKEAPGGSPDAVGAMPDAAGGVLSEGAGVGAYFF